VVEDGHIRFIYATTATADPLPPMPLNGRGIAVRAVRTGETQLVHDTSKDPDFAMDGEPSSLCSELDIPIKIDGKVVALINLETPRLNAYSEQDRRVVEILSEHVASVLYRIREESRLRGMEEERERGLADGAAEAVDMARRDLSMPLQTIQNASYLIRRRLVGAEEGANKIDNAVDLCVSTLDGLRMITNPQLLRRQPHDLNHLLRRSLTDSGISGKVKVKFMNATPVMAYVDGTKLGSVITNLLRKASESMPKGGDLSVDIGVNGDAATISITDTGSYHTRDSAPGESTPSRIAILDETSLEFILCRRIVEAHGGEIHLHKREKSSDLTIKLPTGEGVPQKIRRYVNTSL
jgi:K+-sensing histidine kinase KdpD